MPLSVQYGAVLSSPLEDVTARVWWYVVKQHLLENDGAHAVVARAMTDDGFADLAPADLSDRLVTCASCNDVVIDVEQHQRLSRRCKIAAAANRVNVLWHPGYCDPLTMPRGAPLSWSELRASRWRQVLELVEFSRWNAALVRRPARKSFRPAN
jgi:hypothetical protein